ncbi:MAG TPA: TonB-dependent receptor [Sphingomicrobium sp.]|nr:TonB-dependent receptor [Sphingomicrobium sp.]
MVTKKFLLSGSALLLVPATAGAQEAAQPAQTTDRQAQAVDPYALYEEDSQEIIVTGSRPRGSVIGDIPPENTLDSRDVMATGANDINELLDALAPQIGSARGRGSGRPVMLLNGQRISSFRELRDLPTEAISRVEILPEEVALKYGYRADQRVVNIVLRERFHSTTVTARGNLATEGGYVDGTADVTRLMIGKKGRTTINLRAEGNEPLTESERDIALEEELSDGAPDPREARTLIGSKRDLRGSVTVKRQLGEVGATGNVELEHSSGRSLIGLGETLLEPLARNATSDTAHAGIALNGDLSKWHWSVTGNADAGHNVTKTDRDLTDVRDRAESTTVAGDVDATANGTLFRLPAGDAGATVRVGASTLHLDSDRNREGVETSTSLGRTRGSASLNVDLPISRRTSDFGPVGNLTLNGNAEVEQLSDFGTLTTIGAGANWSPVKRLNLLTSWTLEEGAPSVQQLGDPILETPDTRIFDFTTGETVLANVTTGGNPALLADKRRVLKLGANWQPIEETDLRLRTDYVHSHIDRPIANFPGPTAALEEAFPDRFVRNGEGELVSVDLRPVNFDSATRDTLRLGVDFSKPLKSAPPSEAARAAFRQRAGESGAAQSQNDATQSPGRGRGRFSGGRGGRDRGRLTFSLTDTITLTDEVSIRPGLDKLDYLHGDAFGQSGGRPRHEVEARAGYYNNGLGARLSADWRSGTRVETSAGDDLRFSPLATFDLRLWANLGQRYDLVARHPWLRGSSVRFEVRNLLDSKPKVRDSVGEVPFGYQPDLLDPLGRTIGITFRKLFLPPPSFFRRSDRSGG